MKTKLRSFDQVVEVFAEVSKIDRYREIQENTVDYFSPRGSGLSYAPMSFAENQKSLDMTQFNRILNINELEGWIHVEAGINLFKIYDILSLKGYHLSIQPGHPQITVGGCIACNIFGKNQFNEGLFENLVIEMEIYHPSHGRLIVNREKNSELFYLTCGGFGLTGIIISAILRIKKTPGHSVYQVHLKTNSLAETYTELLRCSRQYSLLYTWNDLSLYNGHFGRGFVVAGNFIQEKKSNNNKKYRQIFAMRKNSFFNLMNHCTVSVLNQFYFFLNTTIFQKKTLSEFSFHYPISKKTFYFKLFGKKGFIEKQILIPHDYVSEFIQAFELLTKKHKPVIALCSCKIFSGEKRYLNFNGSGLVISIDVPNSVRFCYYLEALDCLVTEHKGIINICKDSSVQLSDVEAQYLSEYQLFKEKIAAYDPEKKVNSIMSKRLKI